VIAVMAPVPSQSNIIALFVRGSQRQGPRTPRADKDVEQLGHKASIAWWTWS
jgi:hypothetical protein